MGGAAAQLNVRFDADIKRAGDAVLKDAGISSTEFIRTLWCMLADGGEQRRAVLELACGGRNGMHTGDASLAGAAASQSRTLVDDLLKEHGFSGARPKIWDRELDREMLYQELEERMESRLA